MEIEGYDCSEFDRRDHCIPCESLMASQVSSLKGKPISSFLVAMDQREYEVIKIEEAELKAVQDKEWKSVSKPMINISLLALALSVIGIFISVNLRSFGFFTLAAFGMVGSLLWGVAGCFHSVKAQEKIRDIEDNRLARLQNKVGVLETKIEPESESKEEFRVAKDFFKTKYDIYLGQRNRPITNVATYVVSTYNKA